MLAEGPEFGVRHGIAGAELPPSFKAPSFHAAEKLACILPSTLQLLPSCTYLGDAGLDLYVVFEQHSPSLPQDFNHKPTCQAPSTVCGLWCRRPSLNSTVRPSRNTLDLVFR